MIAPLIVTRVPPPCVRRRYSLLECVYTYGYTLQKLLIAEGVGAKDLRAAQEDATKRGSKKALVMFQMILTNLMDMCKAWRIDAMLRKSFEATVLAASPRKLTEAEMRGILPDRYVARIDAYNGRAERQG